MILQFLTIFCTGTLKTAFFKKNGRPNLVREPCSDTFSLLSTLRHLATGRLLFTGAAFLSISDARCQVILGSSSLDLLFLSVSHPLGQLVRLVVFDV